MASRPTALAEMKERGGGGEFVRSVVRSVVGGSEVETMRVERDKKEREGEERGIDRQRQSGVGGGGVAKQFLLFSPYTLFHTPFSSPSGQWAQARIRSPLDNKPTKKSKEDNERR